MLDQADLRSDLDELSGEEADIIKQLETEGKEVREELARAVEVGIGARRGQQT